MIASEECLENVTHEQPYISSKIFDDSQLYSKSFSFIPVRSMTAKRALQIVGMKINLESQSTKDNFQMYKSKRIATNHFIPPTDKHKVNPASETSTREDNSADEMTNCNARRRENEEKASETEIRPILEMILSSVNDDTERLQLQLKSSCTAMELPLKASGQKTETNTAKSQTTQNDAQSIKVCNDEELKHDKNVCSSNSSTAEILPSANSSPNVKETDTDFHPCDSAAVNDALQPSIKFQHVAIQTEGIINAFTDKEKLKKNFETAAILTSAVSSQTITKCEDNASQTEKPSHYNINRFHDMATQTEHSHTAKLSSFKMYDMDRNRVRDQSIQANGIKMAFDDQSSDFHINGRMIPTFSEDSTLRNSIPLFHIQDEMKVNERFCKTPNFEIRNDIADLDKSNKTTEKSKYLQNVLLKIKNNGEQSCHAELKRTSRDSAGKLSQADVVKAQVKSRTNNAKSLNIPTYEKYVSIFDLNIKKPRKIIINPVNIICCSKVEHNRILSRKDKNDLLSLSSKTEKNTNVDLSDKNELSPQFVIINRRNSKASSEVTGDQKEPSFHDGKKISHCQCCNCSNRTQNLNKYAENSYTHGIYKELCQGYFPAQRAKSSTKVGNRNNSCKECRNHAYEITTRIMENLPNSHISDGLGDVTSTDFRMYENYRNSVDVFERFKDLEMNTSEDKCIELLKTIEINTACEVMNYHLLSLTPIDRNLLIKPVRALHEKWFEITAVKDARLQEVRNYLKFFEEFSVNLVKTLMHSVDVNGNNVLHYVYGNNRFDLAEELLRSGHATNLLNKLNKSGNSPLMICAISKPKTESDWFVIQKTIQLGDVNASSPFNNQTPLMHAASWGSHGMVRLLLDAGADPNFQDKDGSTALMYAAAHGHIVCARMLLEHPSCDPSIKDCDGLTAYKVALRTKHTDIALLIYLWTLWMERSLKRMPCLHCANKKRNGIKSIMKVKKALS